MDKVCNLNTLCIPSLVFSKGFGSLSIASLIVNNHATLQHLDLGVEGSIIDCKTRGETYRDTEAAELLGEEIIAAFADNNSVCLPNIDSLRLRGLDLSAMISGDEQYRLLNLASLKHLALESCSGMNNSLLELTSMSLRLRGLQTFHIRQEEYEDDFLKNLENFLCTLPPLTSLSILLNGPSPDAFKIKQIMKVHGLSLRTCIMDLREGDRIALVGDSRPAWRKQYSVDIIVPCPNLVELGISVDWETLDLGSWCSRWVRKSVIIP